MNDRDTQKAAAEDLLSIVVNMDQEGLPIILSALCSTGSEHKVYARKECARAIGIIASEACPRQEQALQQPHLGKMLLQLRKSLQDADSSVREASSEALAVVAQGLSQLGGGPQGNASNPVIRLVFESLVEQKKELNAAACLALGTAAPYLGTLDAPLARELVRKLNSPSFQAPAALLQALARTDPVSGEPIGLLKSGPAAFVPLLSALVGQPAQPLASGLSASTASGGAAGSGVAGALFRPDWPVRLAAADMLRATGMLLGPLMELDGCWSATDPRSVTGRAIRGLEACRFDKVRDVRDVARGALTVLEELQAYGIQGGSAAGWPAHIAAKLYGKELPPFANPAQGLSPAVPQVTDSAPSNPPPAARNKSPLRRSVNSPSRRPRSAHPRPSHSPPPRPSHSPPPRRSPTPPERRSSPLLTRTGSLSERFRAAHQDADVVAVRYPGAFISRSGSAREWEQDATVEVVAEGQGRGGKGGAGCQQEAVAAAERPPPAQAWPQPQDDTAPDVTPTGRATSRQLSKASSRASRVAEAPPLMAVEPQFSLRSGDAVGGAASSRQLPPPPSSGSGDAVGGAVRQLEKLGIGNDTRGALDSEGPPTFSRPWQEPTPDSSGVRDSLPAVLVPAVLEALAALPAGPPAPAPVPAPPPLPSSSLRPTVSVPRADWLAAQQRVRELEAQNRQLLESFDSLSRQSSQAIAGLEAKIRELEAALAATQSQPNPPSTSPSPVLPASGQDAGGQSSADVAWLSRTIRPGSPMMPPSSAVVGAVSPRAPPPVPPPPAPAVQAPPAVAVLDPQDPSAAGTSGGGGLAAAPDVRQAYREALSSGRVSDMHLLRLMQRTGPIWHELGQEVAAQLLASFTASLQQARAEGPMLSRVMPWLWRLADEDNNRFVAPNEMRAPLLAALAAAQPSVTDPALYERATLLISTLRTHWSIPATARSNAQRTAGGYPPAQLPYPGTAAASQQAGPAAAADGTHGQAAVPVGGPVRSSFVVPYNAAPQGDVGGAADPGVASVFLPVPSAGSPVQDGPVVPVATPRVSALRGSHASRTPSISTLMGQLSDLQRDFAAMSSPAGKTPGRG